MQYIASFFWTTTTTAPAPPLPPLPATKTKTETSSSECTHYVDLQELEAVRANLRRVSYDALRKPTRKFASRFPHVNELEELAQRYAAEQQQLLATGDERGEQEISV